MFMVRSCAEFCSILGRRPPCDHRRATECHHRATEGTESHGDGLVGGGHRSQSYRVSDKSVSASKRDGLVCLITGGGSGIGRAAALALARDGHRVVIAGRRKAQLEETASQADAGGPPILSIQANVTQAAEVNSLFAEVGRVHGRLDVLFNNAGMNVPATPLEDLSLDQWQAVVDVNLTGVFLCTQAAFRVMKEQTPRGGRIINNGSISAHVPRPLAAAYTATKHAVTGLTKSTSLEGRKYQIACGQIDIGNTQTELAAVTLGSGALQANGSSLVEPLFDVQHVGRAIAYMVSLPLDANVQFMTVMATTMPYIGRG